MLVQDYIDKKLVHSIHTSVRRSFRACRRRWNWAYRELIFPLVTPAPLEFGVAFHSAMEVFYDPQLWYKDHIVRQGLALVRFKTVCDEQLKEYARRNGEPEVPVLLEYKERVKLGLNMIRYYTEHVSPYYDHGFTPVEVEVEFEIPITDPDNADEVLWCKCNRCWLRWSNSEVGKADIAKLENKFGTSIGQYQTADNGTIGGWLGLPVTYGGRLDMLAKDEYGRYWVYDWKTTSRMLDEDAEASFLTLDDQISSYVWALRTLGYPVAGFVYVEIKKAYPSAPEELAKLYKGRRYSTNKQHFTTPEIFRQFVAEHDSLAYAEGLYDDHLEWLKNSGPKFHQRHQVHKNDHEVTEVGRNIWLEAQDIIGNPRVYPQPGRFSCSSCLYRQPCIGMNQGEDYEYTLKTLFEKREKHYYEEKPSSTE